MTLLTDSHLKREDPEANTSYGTFVPRPTIVSELNTSKLILTSPFISPLVFENSASDARDHCANERNFLSWLRLSLYLAIISVAITMQFQLKEPPTKLEKKMALPLGILFWLMALLSFCTGLANYVRTVQKYRLRKALVQNGLRTQVIVFFLSFVIVGTCVVFLTTSASKK